MAERLYTVVSQQPRTIITATNQVVNGIQLHIEAQGGIAFTLDVPEYLPADEIDRLIRARLNERYRIAHLGAE